MRIESLETAACFDPQVGDPWAKTYGPFKWLQYLQRFRTEYSLSHTAVLTSAKGGTQRRMLLIEAKRDAYKQHVMKIEHALIHSRGGIEEIVTSYEDEDGGIVEYIELMRKTHGYIEMLESGLPINAKVGLLYLKGSGLKWIRYGTPIDGDMERFAWVSEVGLGLLSLNHEWHGSDTNPFKLSWRDA